MAESLRKQFAKIAGEAMTRGADKELEERFAPRCLCDMEFIVYAPQWAERKMTAEERKRSG